MSRNERSARGRAERDVAYRRVASPLAASLSRVGLGITPPKVLDVMFGVPRGGTICGGQIRRRQSLSGRKGLIGGAGSRSVQVET